MAATASFQAVTLGSGTAGASSDTSNGSPYTTSSFTPAASTILAICVSNSVASGTAATPTITDTSGRTWTSQGSQTINAGLDRQTVYTSNACTGAAITISAAITGSPTGCIMQIYVVTGAGSTINFASGQGGATHPTATLAAAPNVASVLLAWANSPRNPAAWTVSSPWTRDQDTGYASPLLGQDAYQAPGSAGSTITATGSGGSWACSLIEVTASTGTPTGITYIASAEKANSTNANSLSTTFTPPPASLLVVAVGNTNTAATAPTPTVTATGMTFTQQGSTIHTAIPSGGSGDAAFSVWTSPASGTSVTLTAGATGANSTGIAILVYAVTPYGPTTPVQQTKTGTSFTMSLTSTPNTGSACLAFFAQAKVPGLTAPGSWTKDTEASYGNPNFGIDAMSSTAQQTCAATGGSGTVMSFGIEINATDQGGGGGSSGAVILDGWCNDHTMGDQYVAQMGRPWGGFRENGGYGQLGSGSSIIKDVAYANKVCAAGGVISTNIKMTTGKGANRVEPPLHNTFGNYDYTDGSGLHTGQFDSELAMCWADAKKVKGPIFMEMFSEANVANKPPAAQSAAPDGPWGTAVGALPPNATSIGNWVNWICYIVDSADAAGVTNINFVISLAGSSAPWHNGGTNDAQVFIKSVLDAEDLRGKRFIDCIGIDAYAHAGQGPANLWAAAVTYANAVSNTIHTSGIKLGVYETGYTAGQAGDGSTGGGLYPPVTNEVTWYNAVGIYITANQSSFNLWTQNCWQYGPDKVGGFGGANFTSYQAMTALPVFAIGGSAQTILTGNCDVTTGGTATLTGGGIVQDNTLSGDCAVQSGGLATLTGGSVPVTHRHPRKLPPP